MKKLLFLILLIPTIASAQWIGGTLQGLNTGNKQLRGNFGSGGFIPFYTKGQIDSLKATITGNVSSVFGRTGVVTAQTGDYSSFYPLLNGTGATGTWGIGITGNSGTVTNGVYTTTFNALGDARYPLLSGSYANPSWITNLAWGKITGTPTTIAGYGITDFNTLGDARYWKLSGGNTADGQQIITDGTYGLQLGYLTASSVGTIHPYGVTPSASNAALKLSLTSTKLQGVNSAGIDISGSNKVNVTNTSTTVQNTLNLSSAASGSTSDKVLTLTSGGDVQAVAGNSFAPSITYTSNAIYKGNATTTPVVSSLTDNGTIVTSSAGVKTTQTTNPGFWSLGAYNGNDFEAILEQSTLTLAANTNRFYSGSFRPSITATSSGNVTNSSAGFYGLASLPTIVSGAAGTINNMGGLYIQMNHNSATATVDYGTGVRIESPIVSNSAVYNNFQGLNIKGRVGSNKGTNNVNILIGSYISPTGNWNLYSSSSDPSYHASNLQLGSATPTAGAEMLQVTGTARISSTLLLGNFTVATLPTAGTKGRIAYVTDALTPTFLGVLVGGGAIGTLASDNGTNWVAQ